MVLFRCCNSGIGRVRRDQRERWCLLFLYYKWFFSGTAKALKKVLKSVDEAKASIDAVGADVKKASDKRLLMIFRIKTQME